MYTAIFFDIDDTIFDFELCSKAALERTCRSCGLPYSEEIVALFRKVDGELWHKQRQNLLSVEQVVQSRAQIITAQLGKPQAGALFAGSFRENLSDQAIPVLDAGRVLSALSKTYRLYTASNGVQAAQTRRLNKAGFLRYFTDVYVSDRVGFEKPAARFFQCCLERSGLRAEQVLMVGDSLQADIYGAKRAGIDVCWFHPKCLERPEIPIEINYEISALSELLDIL